MNPELVFFQVLSTDNICRKSSFFVVKVQHTGNKNLFQFSCGTLYLPHF